MLGQKAINRSDLVEFPREYQEAAAILDQAIQARVNSRQTPTDLQAPLAYQFSSQGKRVRPTLTLAVGQALGVPYEVTTPFALALEVIHNACLIRDDIEDADEIRRGIPALWCEFGIDSALNVGDYLIMDAFCLVNESPVPPHILTALQREFSEALRATSVGQAADLNARGAKCLNLSEWERIASLKTARLFGLSLTGPALIAQLSDSTLESLKKSCRELGIAFQLRDDLLDLTWAKGRDRPANDVREGKPSFVFAWLQEKGGLSSRERARLLRVIREERAQTSDSEVLWVQSLIARRGAVEAGKARQSELVSIAMERLRATPEIPTRLVWIIQKLLDRLGMSA